MSSRRAQAVIGLLALLYTLALLRLAGAAAAADRPEIGVCLDGNAPWMTAKIWVDVSRLFGEWGQPDKPWEEIPYLKLTPDGYPLRDAGTMTYLRGYPDGTYKLQYEGTAEVSFGGMGQLSGTPVKDGKTTVADVLVDHHKGEYLTMKVSHVDPNDPIHSLRLLMPGIPLDTKQVFTEDFLRSVAPFKVLRFTDWMRTDDLQDGVWKNRNVPASFLQTGRKGLSWECVVALANASHKDIWINVPDRANDDYVRDLARFLHDHLNPATIVYLEYSDELWNVRLPQYMFNLLSAVENRELLAPDVRAILTPGRKEPLSQEEAKSAIVRAAQQVAYKIKKIGDTFRSEFGAQADRVRPILAGQGANGLWIDEGLKFLKQKYGDPGKYLYAIAIDAYVGSEDVADVDKPGLTMDDLFAHLNEALNGPIAAGIRAHKALADAHHLKLLASEGGQHLVAWNARLRPNGGEVNESIKERAQDDPRMGKLLKDLVATWQHEGGGLFMHYSHIGPYSKAGYWGLKRTAADSASVKWNAMMDLLGQNNAAAQQSAGRR